MTLVVEATDLDSVADLLRGRYASMRVSSGDDLHLLRMEQCQLPGVRLDRHSYGMELDISSEPLGCISVGTVRSGSIRHHFDRDQPKRRAGDVFASAPPEMPYTAHIDNLDADYAVMDLALLNEVADGGATAVPIRLLAHQPVNLAGAEQWTRTYAFVRDMLEVNEGVITSPLIAGQAARLLAAVALTVFPHTGIADPQSRDRRDARPETVRRAVAFIEAAPENDISMADIAGAACVTIRAVQLAFQRHVGMNPMAYLRRVRLDHAHRALLAGEPSSTTVTRIAGQWGFPNAGRFAKSYRQAYGQSPSQTLRD